MTDASSTHIVKKGATRVLVIGVLLFLFNGLYTAFFWEKDLDNHGPMLLTLNQIQDTSDVIYFGESSNFTNHPDDTLKLRISDYIALQHPELRIGTVDHGAYHVGMYLPLVAQIDTTMSVRTIIVTMNLRTFNQDVIYGPSEANLRLASRFYETNPPLLNRALVSLNYYDNRSAHERDFLKWRAWTFDTLKSGSDTISFEQNTIRRWCETPKFLDSNGIQDNPKRQLADQYIKAYAFQIDELNPMVKDFDALVQVANTKNLAVVFNLIAENIEDAEYYIGTSLSWIMQQNRDYLVNRYHKENVVVVDNLEVLKSQQFLDRLLIPQEHYDAAGRKTIARNVAHAIKSLPD